jgi:NADH-quinone oxidoreductase subunit M
VLVAVAGIALTMAYLFRMMRGVFYGPMEQKYSHAHDAVATVDRLPLLLMIACSIAFGIFPGHFYDVIRSGVDPLVTRIMAVAPLASENRETLGVKGEAKSDPLTLHPLRLTSGTPHALRGAE